MTEDILEFNEKTDLMSFNTICPICGAKHIAGARFARVNCDNCHNSYNTDFNMSIYDKKAPMIEHKLRWNNKLTIIAEEEYYPSLLVVRDVYLGMQNWEVSEITTGKKKIRYCYSSGICKDCLSCECGHHIMVVRNLHKKLKCPKCDSDKLKKTIFKNIKKSKDNLTTCPKCGSTNLRFDIVIDSDVCPKCGSRNLSEPILKDIYKLVIERKRIYGLRKEEIASKNGG